jgi:Protein of unknown function (DUF3626)
VIVNVEPRRDPDAPGAAGPPLYETGVRHHGGMGPMEGWLSAQERAIAHVAARSVGGPIDAALRVTLNFHPDRWVGEVPILEAMARDGLYRSQFDTGTSNGGLTAHPGGERWSWESRIFGSAYDEVPASERPKYGSLNFRRRATGGSPRFGSAHLRLRQETLVRTTFCYPDSVFEPTHFGVNSRMSLVALAEADDKDRLDDYVEAQVHGPLLLARDVEALVLDPCFQGTDVQRAADRLPCPRSGTTVSASVWTNCRNTRTTEVPSTSSWASRWPRTGASIRGCSVTHREQAAMRTRPSSAYGTTSRASAHLWTPFPYRLSRQPVRGQPYRTRDNSLPGGPRQSSTVAAQ